MQAGVYIHIPFCKSRCSYCDFATDIYRSDESVTRYVSALCREIQNSKFESESLPPGVSAIDTIYFGGGTPSILSAGQVEQIVEEVYRKFPIAAKIEFTLEINPATAALGKLRDFKSLGVNRASFGVQTFNEQALRVLARGHSAADARNTFKLLRQADFQNVSFDLIAGLPNQTLGDWKQNLDEALELDPEHLSLYLLEIHEATPLAEQIRSRRQPLPDEDLAAEMYEMMLDRIGKSGFQQYEISNFAKPGFESQHNLKYWRCQPVFGFGVSAHSFDGKNRFANERETKKYLSLVEQDDSPIVEETRLSAQQLAAEFAFLSLRLTAGLNLDRYQSNFGIDLPSKFKEDLKNLVEDNLLEINDGILKLTRRGMLYSNEVFSIFV